MTDRAKAFLVHLDHDYRIGDKITGADRIRDAIAMIKGVTKVEPLVENVNDLIAHERVRQELVNKLWEVLK